MQACNDATGVEILTGPELAILDGIALCHYPLSCFLVPEAEHRRHFGTHWHGLAPNECVIALGRLASLKLIEVYHHEWRDDELPRDPRLGRPPRTYVRPTPLGGRCWEEAFGVDWPWLAEVIGDGTDGDRAHHDLLQSGGHALIDEFVARVAGSAFAHLIVCTPTRVATDVMWAQWKTPRVAWETRVSVHPEPGGYGTSRVYDFFMALYRELGAQFKKVPTPQRYAFKTSP